MSLVETVQSLHDAVVPLVPIALVGGFALWAWGGFSHGGRASGPCGHKGRPESRHGYLPGIWEGGGSDGGDCGGSDSVSEQSAWSGESCSVEPSCSPE